MADDMGLFDSPKFKRLRDKWTKKLKDSGFKDIENTRGDLIDHQNVYDFSQRIGFRSGLFEEIRDYYYWASDMLHRGRFRSADDRTIWKMHAEGHSSREIGEVVDYSQRWICEKIKHIRRYLQEQHAEQERKRAA